MLDSKDFQWELYHHNGFGGDIRLYYNSHSRYIVKYGSQTQSINEYAAQNLLRSLDFDYIPADLMKIGSKYYGALEYIDDLKEIALSEPYISYLNSDDCRTLIELYILNQLLGNFDKGEYFYKNAVYSLDYGEALLYTHTLEYLIKGRNPFIKYDFNVRFAISNIRKVFRDVLNDEIFDNAVNMLYSRFQKLSELDFVDCLENLERAFNNQTASGYYNYIFRLKNEITKLS